MPHRELQQAGRSARHLPPILVGWLFLAPLAWVIEAYDIGLAGVILVPLHRFV